MSWIRKLSLEEKISILKNTEGLILDFFVSVNLVNQIATWSMFQALQKRFCRGCVRHCCQKLCNVYKFKSF